MSVTQTATRIAREAGNGAKVAFDFSFKIFDETDLIVYNESSSGVYTEKVLTTHYTVDFDSDDESGTVTWVTAPANGTYSVIVGDMPQTQGTTFPREGSSPAKDYENAYDRHTILLQEMQEELNRCVKSPQTPVNPDPIDVDPLEDRRALVAEDNGDGTWTLVPSEYDPDEAQTDAAASATAAAASATAAAGSATAAAASATAAAASAGTAGTRYAHVEGAGAPGAAPATPTIYHDTTNDLYYIHSAHASANWRAFA